MLTLLITEIMKASELRIGNIVSIDGKPVEVNITLLGYIMDDETICEGLPLTKDWLLRFGFTKKKQLSYSYYFINIPHYSYNGLSNPMKFSISEDSNKLFINDHFIMFCRYVHELQNICFAPTIQEIELKK